MKLPLFRRAQPRPTVRSVGAEVFANHASQMLTETRRLVDAVARGDIVAPAAGEDPDYVGLVRRHRASLMGKLDDDLLLAELVERVQRAAVLQELQERYPDLVAAVIAKQRPTALARPLPSPENGEGVSS